jgi:hypothetical protein
LGSCFSTTGIFCPRTGIAAVAATTTDIRKRFIIREAKEAPDAFRVNLGGRFQVEDSSLKAGSSKFGR